MIADELYSFDEQRKGTPKKKRSNIYRCLTNRRSNEGRNYTNCTSREKKLKELQGLKLCESLRHTHSTQIRTQIFKKKKKQSKQNPKSQSGSNCTRTLLFLFLFVCLCVRAVWYAEIFSAQQYLVTS